jgi:hypothetical protein
VESSHPILNKTKLYYFLKQQFESGKTRQSVFNEIEQHYKVKSYLAKAIANFPDIEMLQANKTLWRFLLSLILIVAILRFILVSLQADMSGSPSIIPMIISLLIPAIMGYGVYKNLGPFFPFISLFLLLGIIIDGLQLLLLSTQTFGLETDIGILLIAYVLIMILTFVVSIIYKTRVFKTGLFGPKKDSSGSYVL